MRLPSALDAHSCGVLTPWSRTAIWRDARGTGTMPKERDHAMTFDRSNLSTIVFDYGNTLVQFSHEAVRMQHSALAEVLIRHYGEVDLQRLYEIRAADRMQPYERGYRENKLPELCDDLVRELHGVRPTDEALSDLLRARFESFIEALELPPGVGEVLGLLAGSFALGVISNYPDGAAVRTSMSRIGILNRFEHIVVSGDVGYCKPHRAPFDEMISRLELAPSEILMVGDNWLADIQGAKRVGMKAALTTEYSPIDEFQRAEGDYEPDLVIASLRELPGLLLS